MNQQLSKFLDQTNYKMNVPFILNRYIYEYDISSANVEALRFNKRLDCEFANKLHYELPKIDREILIGKMILKDSSISDSVKQGICHARHMFAELNNLIEDNIFQIRNDAIYVLDTLCKNQQVDNFYFNLKSTYTSYFRLNKWIELFFLYDSIDNSYIYDIKGIKDDLIYLHKSFIEIILGIAYLITETKTDNLSIINSIVTDYAGMKYPIYCYRELDYHSGYRIINSNYSVSYLPDTDYSKKNIDINYNLSILRNLVGYAASIYLQKRR